MTIGHSQVVPYSFSTSSHNFRFQPKILAAVVPYSFSTSSHNCRRWCQRPGRLFLIHFLHQATTRLPQGCGSVRCSLFIFYIKPQHRRPCPGQSSCCSLFIFYIKPQLPALQPVIHIGCSLFIFYIKPQLSIVSRL